MGDSTMGSTVRPAAEDGGRQSPWRTLIPFRRIPKHDRDEIPIHRVGLFSFFAYTWLDAVMWRLFRRKLFDPSDKWRCPSQDECAPNADRLETMWKEELARQGASKASMSRVWMRFIRHRCLVAMLSLVIALALLLFCVAYIMMSILALTAATDDDDALWKGLVLVAALLVTNVLSAFFFIGCATLGHIAAGRLRGAVLFLLYRTLLQTTSLQDETVGKVINLYANDAQRIFDGAGMCANLIAGPLLAIGSTAYAIYLLGAWALIGFGILLLLLPMQMAAGKMFMGFREKAVVITDKRVRMMNEYLANIRFIKMYSWEKPLSHLLSAIRAAEQAVFERVNVSMSVAFMSSAILVSVATIVTLVVYTSCGNHLTGVQGFMYLLIYSCIQDKLELCMLSIKFTSEMFVAAQRFQEVFVLEEMTASTTGNGNYKRVGESFSAIQARGVVFDWPYRRSTNNNKAPDQQDADKHQQHNDLSNVGGAGEETNELTAMMSPGAVHNSTPTPTVTFDFKFSQGSLVGIAGPVSSGKTALMKTLLGQMNIVSGELTISGSIAYVPQHPWIYNATLRDNVLLGAEFDADRYQSVLDACCLLPDLAVLPDGDRTVIGERGTTLSGGQKQRVSLARAVYSQRDVYLIDDPLAAIDPDVATDIFRRVVQDALLGKTVLLVTHQLKFLAECDFVIYLPGDGRRPECGTHEQLMATTGGEYATVVNNVLEHQLQQLRDNQQQLSKRRDSIVVAECSHTVDGQAGVADDDDEDANLLVTSAKVSGVIRRRGDRTSDGERRASSRGNHSSSDVSAEADAEDGIANAPADRQPPAERSSNWTAVDERQGSSVSWKTYAAYVNSAGGAAAVVGVLIASLLAEGARAFSYWWLAYWLEQGSGNTTVTVGNESFVSDSIADNPKLWMYDLVYGISLIAIIIFFTIRSVILMKVLVRASSRLHNRLFVKVMRTPVSFFDVTPIGRIINRFSRDVDEMDSRLPMMVDNTLRTLLSILIYIVLISIIMPWFLLALPIVAIIFVPLYATFRAGIRRLQRLQLASTAPLLGHVDGTVRGLSSIRAYDRSDDFSLRFQNLLNANTGRVLLCHYASRWVNVRLSLVTTLLVSATALLVILLRDALPTGYGGAAIIYSFQLLTLFQFFVRFAVDAEGTFQSTERIHSYIRNLPEEATLATKTFGMPSSWPADGKVEFVEFKMRYGDDAQPAVLDDVTFQIQPSEKIGIVGRTGSGKSSLVAALFRLTEKCGGRIDIDGIDISQVGLGDLRSKLSIIPQDPVLFSGTVRLNLDPFNAHIDLELWNALEKCHMKDVVASLDGQLNGQVMDNGDNFSAGERQLLCLARVLLRHSRIVVLDEATASLDPDTERRVQDTIRQTFAGCTLLIVAHSMSTVLECDRVLVMDSGRVVEFDKPSVLMSDPESKFSRLVAFFSSQGDATAIDVRCSVLSQKPVSL